jgi:hypothetical protein
MGERLLELKDNRVEIKVSFLTTNEDHEDTDRNRSYANCSEEMRTERVTFRLITTPSNVMVGKFFV